jgi:pantoate kinase
MTGGIVLRLKEGSPGFGRTDRIIQGEANLDGINENELFVISKTLGEIETSKIIEDPLWKNRINQTGKNLLDILLKNPDPQTFLKLSRKFAEETALMNCELLEVVEILEEETMGASMAMLGNTAFALSKTPDTSVEGTIISKIDDVGCRYV